MVDRRAEDDDKGDVRETGAKAEAPNICKRASPAIFILVLLLQSRLSAWVQNGVLNESDEEDRSCFWRIFIVNQQGRRSSFVASCEV